MPSINWNPPRPQLPVYPRLRPVYSVTPEEIEKQYGVRVVGVSLLPGSALLSLCFQVAESTRAAALLIPENSPLLVTEANGMILRANRSLTVRDLALSTICNLLYPNVRNAVQNGWEIHVQVGDLRLEHMFVQ